MTETNSKPLAKLVLAYELRSQNYLTVVTKSPSKRKTKKKQF